MAGGCQRRAEGETVRGDDSWAYEDPVRHGGGAFWLPAGEIEHEWLAHKSRLVVVRGGTEDGVAQLDITEVA